MTWLSRRTVRGVGVAMSVSRISLRGIALPAKSVSATGCSPGTESATMTRAPVRWRSVEARFCEVDAQLGERAPRASARLERALQAGAMSRSKSGTSAVVAFSRSLAAWSVSRCCSGGSSASAATAERDDAREDQRGEQPRAQTEGPAPDHCSRKR